MDLFSSRLLNLIVTISSLHICHNPKPKILVMILHKTDYLSIWDICCFKRRVNGIAWMPPIVTKTPKSGSLHQSRLSPPNPIQCNLSMFNAMRINETLSFWWFGFRNHEDSMQNIWIWTSEYMICFVFAFTVMCCIPFMKLITWM